MSFSLFRPGIDDRPVPGATRLSALPVSIGVHAIAVLALVVIPLLATDVLPVPQGPVETWFPAAAAPAPPPPPRPVVRSTAAPSTNPNAAPSVVPNGIAPDDGLDRTPPADAPQLNAGIIDGGIDGGKGLVVEPPPPPPPAARPVAPVRIGPRIKQPTRTVYVQPVYPEVARQARVEGVVIIEAVIGPTGNVEQARVLRSKPLLDEAALAAVRQWKFTPTLLQGVPVPVVMTVTVNFTLAR